MEQLEKRLQSVRIIILTLAIIVANYPRRTHGHGRLIDPPARNSMWRFGFDNPVNYNDNELYCGGRMVQWLKNGGKCGVCGDSFHGDRPHEAGGKYAKGIITKTYEEGGEMDITVHLTANHLGFFEFRLCPNNNPKSRVKQECLDKFLLERADGEGTKFQVPKGKYNAMFNYTLKLPRGLTCHQCVIQWKYRTGNTWDKEIDSGRFCLGCGPQEEFYNCADIAIEPRRPAVIEYPTSQPDPPQFLPTINLPTVATIKPTQRTSRSIFTKTPEKNRHTTKYKKPPVRLPTMPLPPMPPGIPPPPRLPHSKTRPVNKKRPKPQEMTSIFTTPTPRRLKTYRPKKTLPTTPIRTVRRSRKTTRRKTTTSTRATTTTSKPTTTTATTTTATTTTTAKTTIPTTTTTTTPKTTSVKTTTRTTTTPRKTTRRRTKRTKPTTTASPPTQRRRVTKLVRTTKKPLIRSRLTTPSNPKKTTHYYKIVQRRTWGPPTRRQPSRATSPKTTKQTVKKQQKKPSKTKETPKSPFQRPTTVRYKYWKPRVSKYPLLKDNLELEDIKEVETVTKSTRRARKPSTKRPKITTSKQTTRKTTTTATTTPRKTTPTTTKRYKKTTPPKTTTATTTKESTRTTALVKWWTNKPDTTTKYRRRPTTTIAFTRPTRTQHKWSTPSFWWPPIWLPWTPWAKRTRRVDSTPTTTTQRTTTTTRQTTTKAQTTTSQVPRTYPTTHFINVKEGGEIVRILDNTIEKVSSNEALPWYIGGDLGWKSASPPGGDETRLYDRISKNPQTKTKTSEEPSGPTTLLPCLQSTTPKPEHRDNLVKSPFLLPKNDKRKTPALKPTQKTPPVWLRTVIPPVVQPVQPPPLSHHLWVKKNVKRCRAIIPLAVGMNDWCFVNCNSGFCPRKFCYCENKYKRPRYRHFTKKPPLWWKESLRKPSRSSRPRLQQRQRAEASRRERVSDRQTALQNIKQNMYRCRGVGKYSDRPEFDDWCQTNCRTVLCPLLICGCTWR